MSAAAFVKSRSIALVAVITLASVTACSQRQTTRQKLASSIPYDRAVGAIKVEERRDPENVAQLVGLLDDSDVAVRMYAILALERMFGTTFGFKYYAPDDERLPAVQRWQAAIRNGELKLDGAVPSETPAAPHDSSESR